ncbi:hypothetical protein [Lacisediminihabitans changchengi]|uniref:Uncharacterized protein n=1 Tax=Lacisediminihabitans changchengi TaxID=2787634 RepID=A0A934SJW2_9MICO|nr:hypothetical protein [Lacisediminihabitans changchengi]MBK4346918.1 hypothetical protein [Lacisediminihabitans changchengi]MBK4347959.1 hypothetical protein [Lacisediminihabitans changchengi]
MRISPMALASLIGVGLALIELPTTLIAPLSAVLGVAVAVCAALGILGRGVAISPGLGVPILAGAAAASLRVAWFVAGEAPLPWLLLAAVLYLAAATLFGFAATKQGVTVGVRTGLLVLLLFAIIPWLNLVAMAAILFTSFRRSVS